MEHKKKIFSILGKIEQRKIEKKTIKIKSLLIREQQNINQLNILTNYQTEYLNKMHEEMKSGISRHSWENYNNFIIFLDKIIQKNIYIIKHNKKIIKENLNSWSQSQRKLNVWKNFYQIYKKKMDKIQTIQSQIMNDTCIQLKYFQQDNYANIKNDK